MSGELIKNNDFDNMNINKDDINHKKKEKLESDYEEDFLQDDIPIDDDDDEDGMISDNYEQLAEKQRKEDS